jgi:hypothetical protein
MNAPRILLVALLAGPAACAGATPVTPDVQRTPEGTPRHNGSAPGDTAAAPDAKGSTMPVVSHPAAPEGKGSTIPVV